MILVIRIVGDVEIRNDVKETMFRMGIRRKYSAVLMEDNETTHHILDKVRNFVAYGPISKEMISELITKRGQKLAGKKTDVAGAIAGVEKKDLREFGLKPFFRLHPPRGGIDSKIHFGKKKGVLGDNKEKINDLLRRML